MKQLKGDRSYRKEDVLRKIGAERYDTLVDTARRLSEGLTDELKGSPIYIASVEQGVAAVIVIPPYVKNPENLLPDSIHETPILYKYQGMKAGFDPGGSKYQGY